MADIRYVRPPSDNKIRNNMDPEFPSHSGVIHVTTPQIGTVHEKKPRDLKQEPSWKMFMTSWPGQAADQNKEATATGRTESHGEISSDSFHPKQSESVETPERNASTPEAESTEVQLFQVDSQHNSGSTEESESPLQINNNKIEDKSNNTKADTFYPQNKGEIPNESGNCKDFSGTSVIDDSTSVMKETRFHKCYVGYVISSFAGNAESGLVDVKDEETEKLPDVQYKRTAYTPQRHRYAIQTHKPNLQNDGNQTEEAGTALNSPRNIRNIQKSPRKLWRSISEASIIRENSFFGSVKNSHDYTPFCSSDSENDVDEIRMDVMKAMKSHTKRVSGYGLLHRSAWELDTLHENGQNERETSYENKHDAKLKCFSLKKNLVSSTPVQEFYSFVNKNNEENDIRRKEDTAFTDQSDVNQEFVDRLRMRRGALAEPEKMIMSQDVREKIERDVAKRKTSMTRRLSQFFNIQLGLNKEEDLI